jgi:prolyl oligopeptidase
MNQRQTRRLGAMSTVIVNGYPPAEREDIVERLHGHTVADPYRWLEDAHDPRTKTWLAAQDELARSYLDALPGRDMLRERLTGLIRAGGVGVPTWRAGRAFFTRREPGQEHAVLHVRDAAGTERVLIDPTALDPSGATTLDAWSPSLEGERLAYQLSVGGNEESMLHVLDVATGEMIEGPITRCRYSPVAWLPGGDELFYVRRLPPDAVPDGEEQFHRRVLRHRIGAVEADLQLDGPGLYDEMTYYFGLHLSRDGRWLSITASPGTAPRDCFWILDLYGDHVVHQVLTQDDAVRCVPWVERDGLLYLLTTDGAPRWRLCVTDPTTPHRKHWHELIAEDSESVLDSVRYLRPPSGPHSGPYGSPALLVASRTRHAVAELHLHDAASGVHCGMVELPGTGSFTGLSTVDDLTGDDLTGDDLTGDSTVNGRGKVWIGWTDFLTPPSVHVYDLAQDSTSLLEPAPGTVELPDVHTAQVGYTSTDGQMIRMFVVSPVAEPDASPRPALLTGYGGFAVSYPPYYSPMALAWVLAGGVWALASLRGGAEEGEQWHRAGMRERKQNTFDDFHAAGDELVARGWTTPEQLAIVGGSNGGLLVGAALTQRPSAYRAVVCSAPLLDMVRYERFLLGRTWNDEYGTADDPEELGWLLSYSPYHHVRSGVIYPAVLFTVFESDSRVHPSHARKMCAALQHATSADPASRPVLLRRETEVGHGARSVSRTVELLLDEIAFLGAHTGLVQ